VLSSWVSETPVQGGINMGGTSDSRDPTLPALGRIRLDSIDLLRGLVMVIMALDHVRDYFHNACFTPGLVRNPVDLSHPDVALFFTRWVTHFCAPTFVFLAGTGAFLAGTRGKSTAQLSWFLLTRGLWLAFLEATLVRLSWNFHLDYSKEFGGGVIFAIGWSMVALSGLVFLPTAAVAAFGVGIIAFHNMLDGTPAAAVHLPESLWMVLHQSGRFELLRELELGGVRIPAIHFTTGYCLLPWLGVLAAGYGFGAMFLLDRPQRRKQLIGLGLALIVLFALVRFGNAYGDLRYEENPEGPWSVHDQWWVTVLSFINCQKYPPSLLFVLMTLGPAILALGLFDRAPGALGRFLVTFGRVPLFYYLLHLPLIHGLRVGLDYLRSGWSPFAREAPFTIRSENVPAGYGYDLPVVYLVWVAVVLTLYPLCRWFAGVKQRHPGGWLSYF
jgi:uncharacterized membrane protein